MSCDIVLCTLENLREAVGHKVHIPGTLSLVQRGEVFYLFWAQLSPVKLPSITAAFEYEKPPGTDDWVPCERFNVETTKIKSVIFSGSEVIQFVVKRSDKPNPRTFIVDENESISFIILLQQLLKFGIAVPSNAQRYSLDFYQSGYINTFLSHPTHIRMGTEPFKTLEELWNRLLLFYTDFLSYLNDCSALPIDPSFPYSLAARTAHQRILENIKESISTIKDYEGITRENFQSAFDENGKLSDPQEFRSRLLYAPTDPDALPLVIPFVVGLFPFDSSSKERDDLFNGFLQDYKVLEEQFELLQTQQILNHEKLTGYFKVIENDVKRTDRNLTPFKNEGSPAFMMLTKFLKMFVLYNPPISYLQGMNDLMVPIITAFVPNWSEDGTPIDKDGNLFDYKKEMPMMFWCFYSMLFNTRHSYLLQNVTNRSPEMAEEVNRLLFQVSPLAAIWLKRNNLHKLLWCYSDFVLMFKRSFETIWPTWIKFNVSPQPHRFLVLLMTAVITAGFDQFAQLNDTSITIIMDLFPKILSGLDTDYLGKVALWIHKTYPLPDLPEDTTSEPDTIDSFDFFEPSWK